MGKSEASAKIFELTDIVEEGLPLDELPEIRSRKASQVEPAAPATTVAATAPVDSSDKTGFSGEDDFSLDLDDFSDLDMDDSENDGDPVLTELKNAGLKARIEALSNTEEISEKGRAVVNDNADDLFDDDFDDLDDFDNDFLDETAVDSGGSGGKLSAESIQSREPDIELPEDYLVDDELLREDPAAVSETDAPPSAAGKPESGSPVSPLRVDPVSASATHQIFTEPQALDFSQQIEDMTQEWSKQLLQTTYASMDKMIKAIGDLAPTIVDQVAREVIPPLAEKVIKAEIARLEEKLELEEGEEQ